METNIIYREVLLPLGFIEEGVNIFSFRNFEIDMNDIDERNIMSHIFTQYYKAGYNDGKAIDY